MKPRVGLLLGDPTGIGPELVAKFLAGYDVSEHADVVVIGDRRVFEMGQKIAGTSLSLRVVGRFEDVTFDAGVVHFLDFPGVSPDEFTIGQLSAKAGKSVLEVCAFTLDLARDGKIDAVLYAPFNKEAQHLGGSHFDDETHFIVDHLQWKGYVSEINILDNLWASRVTSHVGLKQVSSLITKKAVHDAIVQIDAALRMADVKGPRIFVAALNPHGGEGGLFGTEEIEAIAPAIKQACSEGIQASGPFPADTIFVRAKDGACDAVVSMYHDQGQIGMKLMGFARGVSLVGMMPFPVVTTNHGTAFDIAGQGKANPQSLYQAFRIAASKRRIEEK